MLTFYMEFFYIWFTSRMQCSDLTSIFIIWQSLQDAIFYLIKLPVKLKLVGKVFCWETSAKSKPCGVETVSPKKNTALLCGYVSLTTLECKVELELFELLIAWVRRVGLVHEMGGTWNGLISQWPGGVENSPQPRHCMYKEIGQLVGVFFHCFLCLHRMNYWNSKCFLILALVILEAILG